MKQWIATLLILALTLSLCACGTGSTNPTTEATAAPTLDGTPTTEATENKEITVTDMIGREVSVIPGSYKRVVCVGAGALRMYSYIGDVNLLAGVEDIDNTTLAEKILACEPDIVISEFEDVEKSDALQQQLGVPVITLKSGSKGVFDDSFAGCMELLGKLFGMEEKAQTLLTFIEKETAAIQDRVAGIPEEEKPSVYICGLGNWGTTNHLMTAENYVSFEVAGVKNVVSGLEMTGIGAIEAEKFVELSEQMDIVIMDAAAVKNIKPLYQEDPTMFDTCKAWQNGEVYLEMAYNAYYTNFEIALINTWFIAKTVYPEAFADVDMTAKTNEVTKMFLGEELAEEIFSCGSSFGGYQKIDTQTFFN